MLEILLLVLNLSLPDPKLTPGATVPITLDELCSKKWGLDKRHVTPKMKDIVFKLYGLSGNDDPQCGVDKTGRHCEIDHLISRELGGADEVDNLWPEPYSVTPDTKWTATQKDRIENRLHKEVCEGHISLEEAQQGIAKNWIEMYKKYFGDVGLA